MSSTNSGIVESTLGRNQWRRLFASRVLPLCGMAALAAVVGCSSQSVAGGGTGGKSATGGGSVTTGGSSGTGGVSAGTGGNASGGGVGTGGGSVTGGRVGSSGGGSTATGGSGGSGALSGGAGASGNPGPCPANATFCSSFEEAGLPMGAVYKVNAAPGDWSRDYALDTAVHNGGNASLRVRSGTDVGTSGSAYKMLAVPATPGAFWVRFYIRSDLDLGGVDHNAFTEASGSDDPNDAVAIEFAEDVGLAFNTKDDVRWPVGYGRTTSGGTNPFSLLKNTWHCIEISYDGQTRHQALFVDGTPQIDASNYPMTVGTGLKVFKFGFLQYHGPPRNVWYDDVAVAPQRIPCS